MPPSPNLARQSSKTTPYWLLLGLLLLLLIPAAQSQSQAAPVDVNGPAGPAAPPILVFTDDPVHHRPPESVAYVIQALEREGLEFVLVDDDVARFEEAMGEAEWELVIMANDVLEPTKTIFEVLDEYVRKGGRLIIHTWAMGEVADAPLWETLGVRWVETNIVAPRERAAPLFWWDRDHPVFNDPNEKVPQFLEMANTWEKEWPVEHKVEPAKGFEPLAGYAEEPTEGASGLVVGNYGVTAFRGFVDFINEADGNENKIPDPVELWQNLIRYVLKADPRPGAFSKLAPANNATGVQLDVLLDWNGSARSSRYYYCIDTINNNACDSGWQSTSATSALVKDLAPDTAHYWQVRANNLYGTTYANTNTWWKFTTGSAPGSSTLLPLVMSATCTSFPSSTEIESNDTAPEANGPLCFGSSIYGNPNNPPDLTAADQDWFLVSWSGNGTLHVEVTNYLYDAQVILKDAAYNQLDKVYWAIDGHYQIDYEGTGVAGTYYVQIFAPDGHPTDSGDYTLTISVQ